VLAAEVEETGPLLTVVLATKVLPVVLVVMPRTRSAGSCGIDFTPVFAPVVDAPAVTTSMY
jgi:hypothetical protein